MRSIKCVSVVVVGLCLWLGAAGSALAEEIVVSAAASLTEAFTEAKAVFEKAHPGAVMTVNFAASGPLLRQIEQGAPVDVFASADQETMDKAAEKSLIDPATRVSFVGNALVLVVPAVGSPGGTQVAVAADLGKPAVAKVSVGNPDSVPVGRYARESLTAAGLWDALQPKIIMGNSVKQVLDYAARGEVDAAIVFATDAKSAGAKVKVVEVMGKHKPIAYPVAVVAASTKKALAAAFIAFITGAEGQAICAKYGFTKP